MTTKEMMDEAIQNISSTSASLEKICNEPKNYNVAGFDLLEMLVWELKKQASDLRSIRHQYGV